MWIEDRVELRDKIIKWFKSKKESLKFKIDDFYTLQINKMEPYGFKDAVALKILCARDTVVLHKEYMRYQAAEIVLALHRIKSLCIKVDYKDSTSVNMLKFGNNLYETLQTEEERQTWLRGIYYDHPFDTELYKQVYPFVRGCKDSYLLFDFYLRDMYVTCKIEIKKGYDHTKARIIIKRKNISATHPYLLDLYIPLFIEELDYWNHNKESFRERLPIITKEANRLLKKFILNQFKFPEVVKANPSVIDITHDITDKVLENVKDDIFENKRDISSTYFKDNIFIKVDLDEYNQLSVDAYELEDEEQHEVISICEHTKSITGLKRLIKILVRSLIENDYIKV